jgi:four helix bundle protein
VRRKHHDLEAWKTAIELVKHIYGLTTTFPPNENYGLTSQIRSAAVSVPSNIAEGCARFTDREFLHFLGIARGSLSELETQLIIARELGYLPSDAFPTEQLDKTFSLLGGLINHLRKKADA